MYIAGWDQSLLPVFFFIFIFILFYIFFIDGLRNDSSPRARRKVAGRWENVIIDLRWQSMREFNAVMK
jgi:hypothetical protein